MAFGKNGRVHAIFEDGYHVCFDWDGWPENIDPIWDTPEIEDEQKIYRKAHLVMLAGEVAGPHYNQIKVEQVWVENNGESYYDIDVLDKLAGVCVSG